jgi:hypothetical protein
MRIQVIQPSISARESSAAARSAARAIARSPNCAAISLADRQISISLSILRSIDGGAAPSSHLLLCRQSERRTSLKFVSQHKAKMLFCQRECVLKYAKRACCVAGVTICSKELLDQSPLLCNASFKFNEVPPCGGLHRAIHVMTPRR